MLTGYFFTRNLKLLVFAFSILSLSLNSVFGQVNASKSDLKVRLFNLEGPSSEVFRYYATLSNNEKSEQVYQLDTKLPPGWSVAYKLDGMQVTSVSLEPEASKELTIEVTPSYSADSKKHVIPFRVISNGDTTAVNLESVVKGTYKMELSTQNQVLSGNMTTGSAKEIMLVVKNTGSLVLDNIELSSQLPNKWEANYEPSKIDKLLPGASQEVKLNVKVPEKTIAGDYMINLSAKNNNVEANVAYRMEIKTSLLTGWFGFLLIVIALGMIYFLVRKYGRR